MKHPLPASAALAVALLFAGVTLAASTASSAPAPVPAATIENPKSKIQNLPSPAGADTHCANLAAAPDGTVYLTYYGPAPASATLLTATPSAPASASTLENPKSKIENPPAPLPRTLWLAALRPGAAAWSAPLPVVTTPLLMENWADFASLAVGTDGALTAQWFQKTAADGHGYAGWYSRSEDSGRTWRAPAPLGHEFVALAPLSRGRTLAVWLESARAHDTHAPRKKPSAAPSAVPSSGAQLSALNSQLSYFPAMKLLARLLAPDGSSLRDWTVDPDVCTCCQNTVAVLPGDRVFVAYRGHTAAEIRDNRSTVFDLAAGTWSAPAPLRDDDWKIPACPVNGPAADAVDSALAVAWFTAADSAPRVRARYSPDAGRTFTAPVVVDIGKPMGRLDTVVLPDGTAVVTWLELGSSANAAGLYARRLFPDGALSAPLLLADTTQARAAGFPRTVLRPDGRVLVALTRTGEKNRVHLLDFDPAALVRPVARTVRSAPAPVRAAPAPLDLRPPAPAPGDDHP